VLRTSILLTLQKAHLVWALLKAQHCCVREAAPREFEAAAVASTTTSSTELALAGHGEGHSCIDVVRRAPRLCMVALFGLSDLENMSTSLNAVQGFLSLKLHSAARNEAS
jgi:hypothetical protein